MRLRFFVTELCGNWVKKGYIDLRCVSYRISLIFFAKCDLISLGNTPTKFREAAFLCYGFMWKLGEKGIYWFTVR